MQQHHLCHHYCMCNFFPRMFSFMVCVSLSANDSYYIHWTWFPDHASMMVETFGVTVIICPPGNPNVFQ